MAKKDILLSVVLATYNEEHMLDACLSSVADIADEIIVVDGESSDNTVDIAKKYGAKVIVTKNHPIFHINKQKALDAAKGSWILQLDADERVTKKLAQQIMDVVSGKTIYIDDPKKQELFLRHKKNIEARDGKFSSKDNNAVNAYFIPRLNYFLGGYLRHGGVYPDGVIRLVKKGKAHFPCKSVHEQIQVDGSVSWLSEDLLHYGDPTFSRYMQRANRYTSLTADDMSKNHVSLSFANAIHYIFIKPIVVWALLFFRHRGFLDGFPGFVFALFSGLHFAFAYMKYWDMKHNGKTYTK